MDVTRNDIDISKILNDLVEKINTISRQKTTIDICRLASEHIVKLFDFDYAVVSLFDFQERGIASKKENSYVKSDKALGRQHPHNWIDESKYSDDDKDILVQVFHKKRNIKTVGKHVFDDGADEITFAAFNKHIFETYHHEELGRFYIPIIHREAQYEGNPDKSFDSPLGVIEIGIKEPNKGDFSTDDRITARRNFARLLEKRYDSTEALEKLLQLYTDNFAQPCYLAMVAEESDKLLGRLTQWEKNYSNPAFTYEKYASDVITQFTAGLKADWGVISFRTFDSDFINYADKATYFSDERLKELLNAEMFKPKDEGFKNGMVAYVFNESGAAYYSDDVTKPGEKYVEAISFPSPVRSEMVVPVIYENEIVGVVDMYSVKKEFFNAITVAIIKKATEVFVSFYMAKKRQHAYNSLLKPTETWINSREIYRQLVKLLSEYYNASSISLWTRDISKTVLEEGELKYEYSLLEGFNENREFISLLSTQVGITKSLKVKGEEIQPVELHYEFGRPKDIFKFCRDNGFKFFISLTIIINNKYDIFTNIFSRFDIFKKGEDKEKTRSDFLTRESEFLNQIGTKVSLSLQNLRIIESLKEMSEPIASGAPEKARYAFRKIVKSAQKATGADFVTLFPFYPDAVEIRKKDGILSNDTINDSEEKAVFANMIFRSRLKDTNAVYYFDTDEECKSFLLHHDPNTDLSNYSDNFRTKNKIKSTCAVRLDFGGEPVGAMFFNYKEPQHLKENSNLKQLISFFSDFAANHIYLRRELDLLDLRYALKQEQLEKMVPLITRTQFYQIVQGVSHILKNALTGISNELRTAMGQIKINSQKKIFEERKTGIENALVVIYDVLTIFDFKDEKTSRSNVDIEQVVNATVNFFKIKIGDSIEYTISSDKTIPPFLCLQAEFAMIIYNLVYNSITAIETGKPKKGKIDIQIGLSPDKNDYVITIEDNGIGIRHEDDEKIYYPGFSTKKDGTGLGLYYIKNTVEDTYSGTVSHQSVYREKTKFTVTIPVSNNYK